MSCFVRGSNTHHVRIGSAFGEALPLLRDCRYRSVSVRRACLAAREREWGVPDDVDCKHCSSAVSG